MTKSSPLIATSLNFESKKIRRIFHQDEWWFSVIDVVGALTESSIPKRYWADLKKNLLEKEEFQPYEKIVQFKMLAEDNKLRETDCANTQTMLRIIQSIPSPKAEPFKMWLAQVGFERIQEIENPELAQKRTREIYKAKGYPDSWIEKRMRGIQVREELTGEWQKRGVKESSEFSILTAEISKATFGLTPNQHKDFKGLKRENLRDHMNDLELIFSMLGEAATTEIARNTDARGFGENKVSARKGGTIAGNARKDLEKQAGKKVVTKENFVGLIKD
jgi:DNA-damage-inducible protein D